jgi:hypothetical protein
MNIRKIMGRLNPRCGSMDGGRGGIPEITPQDLAAAIGMARDEIGREIFCFAWWPDGAKLTQDDVHDRLHRMLLDEFSSRFKALSTAKLELHMLESSDSKRMSNRAVIAARDAVDTAAKEAWPRSMEKYHSIVDAVLMEICAPRQCPHCNGRAHTMHGALAVKCPRCKGRGTVPLNKSWRARQLDVGDTAYRSIWRQPYEWLYSFAAEHEAVAAQQIGDAIGSNSDTPKPAPTISENSAPKMSEISAP